MSSVPATKVSAAQVVLWVGLILAIPLWREFHEAGQPIWNIFLAAFLIALVIGAFFGVRHLHKNAVEVGEARFASSDTDRR